MDHLENLSLVVTAATFYICIYLTDNSVTDTGGIALTLLVVIVNSAMVLYFCYCLVREVIITVGKGGGGLVRVSRGGLVG